MPIVDGTTGALYPGDNDRSQQLQIVSDALLTPVGSLQYRPQVGSILPLLQQAYGRPRRHVPEIAASVTAALAGYVPVEDVVVRELREGLQVHVYDHAVFSVGLA